MQGLLCFLYTLNGVKLHRCGALCRRPTCKSAGCNFVDCIRKKLAQIAVKYYERKIMALIAGLAASYYHDGKLIFEKYTVIFLVRVSVATFWERCRSALNCFCAPPRPWRRSLAPVADI